MKKTVRDRENELDQIISQFRERYFRFFPEKATHLGDHRFDRLLGIWSRQGVKEKITFLEHYRDLVNGSLETKALVLKNITESHLFHLKQVKPYLNPDFFVNQALNSIDRIIYLLEKVDGKEERHSLADSLVARVSLFPVLFEHSRQWLKKTTSVSRDSALYQILFFKKFLQTDYRNFITQIAIERPYKEKLIGVIPFTLENLDRFESFVKTIEIVTDTEKMSRRSDSFFRNLFKNKYALDFSVSSLLKKTEKKISTLKQDLDEISHKDIQGYYRQMAENGKLALNGNNQSDLVLDYFREKSREYLEFCARTGLFPETERPMIQWTPAYKQNTTPLASYTARGPFETMIDHGILHVSPGDGSRFHKQFMNSITIHEIVGHHTAAQRAAMTDQDHFKFSDNLSFDEGFALYTEEIFAREYAKTLVDRQAAEEMIFFMKKAELMRAYRVIVDMGIGTGRMSLDQATEYFAEKNDLDGPTARKECEKYMLNPGAASSYLIGKIEVMDMLDYFQKKEKESFSLAEFNKQLLSFGSIPLSLVKRQMDEK